MPWIDRSRRGAARRMLGPPGHDAEVITSVSAVCLRVPLGTDDELLGWLHLDFRARDPLAVTCTLRAPSGATVLERTVLRDDLRSATRTSVRLADLSIQVNSSREVAAITFDEEHVAVTALVPTDVLQAFLRCADELVAPGDAELDALNIALREMLEQKQDEFRR